MPGIVAFLVGYIAVYLGYPLIFLSYFYSHFCGQHILQIKYIAIYGYIQKGIDAVGVAGGWDGHLEGKIARGVHFPRSGTLRETIDGKGCLGSQMIGGKSIFPTDRHPPGQYLMGGRMPSLMS